MTYATNTPRRMAEFTAETLSNLNIAEGNVEVRAYSLGFTNGEDDSPGANCEENHPNCVWGVLIANEKGETIRFLEVS